MKLVGRQDRVLLAGLTVAVLAVFSRQVRALLDFARDVESSSGVTLLVPLIILTVVFLFHQQSKREAEKARAAAAEGESREAQARAAELEALVVFGQSLGRALDLEAIRDVVLLHLEGLTGTREARVVARRDGQWQMLIDAGHLTPRATAQSLQEYVDGIVAEASATATGRPVLAAGSLWWPMMAGDDIVGFLGVPESHGTSLGLRERALVTAATLLGISLRTAALFGQVRESSVKDGLTGCFNRMHAIEILESEMRRARRSRLPLSLIMFDVDRFKDINDGHGHLCGDAVLAAIGQSLRDILRGSDLKCRYGGEEFLVLLPDTPVEGARRVADTIRREISKRRIPWRNQSLSVTASFGVAVAHHSETDLSAFIGRADSALYLAKEQGRDCVCLSSEPAVV